MATTLRHYIIFFTGDLSTLENSIGVTQDKKKYGSARSQGFTPNRRRAHAMRQLWVKRNKTAKTKSFDYTQKESSSQAASEKIERPKAPATRGNNAIPIYEIA